MWRRRISGRFQHWETQLRIDGSEYKVLDVNSEGGIYSITVGRNKSIVMEIRLGIPEDLLQEMEKTGWY